MLIQTQKDAHLTYLINVSFHDTSIHDFKNWIDVQKKALASQPENDKIQDVNQCWLRTWWCHW